MNEHSKQLPGAVLALVATLIQTPTHKDRILWQKVLLLPDTVSAKLLCCTVLSA